MKSIKLHILFFLLLGITASVSAQDAVIISEGNFVRGTVQGTNNAVVRIKLDDESIAEYKAKDVQEFLWNGNTYVSKPILIRNNMETRFFKVEELGAVNLYSISSSNTMAAAPRKRSRIAPSVGVGVGTGTYGSGVGFGGGISIDLSKHRQDDYVQPAGRDFYYLEKPGTGPLLVVPLSSNADDKTEQIRAALIQKLGDDQDLAGRINQTEDFDIQGVKAYVNAYNTAHK